MIDVINLERIEIAGGWLIDVLSKHMLDKTTFGQITVCAIGPEFVRGNHYHKIKTERICILQGNGKIVYEDIKTKERGEVTINEGKHSLIKIPPKIAHAIVNSGKSFMIALIYLDEPYDKDNPDEYIYKLV
ncbi:MAG: WxcM-like domain-containing protein [Candidatus Bathyarchaeia archaeon]